MESGNVKVIPVNPTNPQMLEEALDELDDFDDEDFESIPCGCKYVSVCLILPYLNGCLNGFIWPGYTLHFEEMGWSVTNAGLAVTIGFVLRMITQQMQLRAGYWLIVPLSAIHLTFAILSFFYWNTEWAVFAEIIVAMGIDPTCAIEGIAFDSFGASEVQARQATSTVLSVFTIAIALSVTIGGTIYDLAGWQGVTAYHSICQGILLLMFCLQPALKNSFVEVFFGAKEDPEEGPQTEAEESGQNAFSQVVPGEAAPPASLPGVVEELVIQEVDELKEEAKPEKEKPEDSGDPKPDGVEPESGDPKPGDAKNRASAASAAEPVDGAKNRASAASATYSRSANPSRKSWEIRMRSSGASKRASSASSATNRASSASEPHAKPTRGSAASGPRKHNRGTIQTGGTGFTKGTGFSKSSKHSGQTVLSAFSRMTSLSEAGDDFRHHFGTATALQPQIVGATGAKAALRDDIETWDADGNSVEEEGPTKRASIPKDVRLPAFLIVLNCFCNTASYVIEFATFAIFFKQVHNWNEAIWASLAQTAGDVMAAIAMQVIPAIFPDNFQEDEAGPIRRFFHYIVSQPYTLTTTLVTWVLFNAGMMSPWLPLAIVAQVFMGSSYVYSSKWSTDMNLFYSLGDSNVFLTLQVYCRNAEAIGGSISGLLGTYLFTLNPIAPFAFSTGLAFLCLVLYTVGFCARLGFGDDIESSEAKRSRRKGIKRVSSWMSDAGNRKSQAERKSQAAKKSVAARKSDAE